MCPIAYVSVEVAQNVKSNVTRQTRWGEIKLHMVDFIFSFCDITDAKILYSVEWIRINLAVVFKFTVTALSV